MQVLPDYTFTSPLLDLNIFLSIGITNIFINTTTGTRPILYLCQVVIKLINLYFRNHIPYYYSQFNVSLQRTYRCILFQINIPSCSLPGNIFRSLIESSQNKKRQWFIQSCIILQQTHKMVTQDRQLFYMRDEQM